MKCEKCGKEKEVTAIRLDKLSEEIGIQSHYFLCEHCKNILKDVIRLFFETDSDSSFSGKGD